VSIFSSVGSYGQADQARVPDGFMTIAELSAATGRSTGDFYGLLYRARGYTFDQRNSKEGLRFSVADVVRFLQAEGLATSEDLLLMDAVMRLS
jgi:hypothetical protein